MAKIPPIEAAEPVSCNGIKIIQLSLDTTEADVSALLSSKYCPFLNAQRYHTKRLLHIVTYHKAQLDLIAPHLAAHLRTGRSYFCLNTSTPLRVCVLTDSISHKDCPEFMQLLLEDWTDEGWTAQEIAQASIAAHINYWTRDRYEAAGTLDQLEAFRLAGGYDLIIWIGRNLLDQTI